MQPVNVRSSATELLIQEFTDSTSLLAQQGLSPTVTTIDEVRTFNASMNEGSRPQAGWRRRLETAPVPALHEE